MIFFISLVGLRELKSWSLNLACNVFFHFPLSLSHCFALHFFSFTFIGCISDWYLWCGVWFCFIESNICFMKFKLDFESIPKWCLICEPLYNNILQYTSKWSPICQLNSLQNGFWYMNSFPNYIHISQSHPFHPPFRDSNSSANFVILSLPFKPWIYRFVLYHIDIPCYVTVVKWRTVKKELFS